MSPAKSHYKMPLPGAYDSASGTTSGTGQMAAATGTQTAADQTQETGATPSKSGSQPARVPSSDQSVVDILNAAYATDSPLTYISMGRQNGLDKGNDNWAAAERYEEAFEGFYDYYKPWGQDSLIAGIAGFKEVVSDIGSLFGSSGGSFLGLGGGSSDNAFVAKWGMIGSFYHDNGGSYAGYNNH